MSNFHMADGGQVFMSLCEHCSTPAQCNVHMRCFLHKEAGAHEYPDKYKPGPQQHWAINKAWSVLDLLKPGSISHDARCLLAGAITAALIEVSRQRSE
jgi:hypothetical protein